MGYTWGQFSTYLRLARRRSAEDRLLAFMAANAVAVGGKSAVSMLSALQAELAATERGPG